MNQLALLAVALAATLSGCAAVERGRALDLLAPDPGTVHVLIFVAHDCPIANGYAPEIEAIHQAHQGDPVRFALVHVDPHITDEEAATHSADYRLTLPLRCDRQHEMARAIGISVSPEAAVILDDGTVAYRGRIDDRYPALGRRRANPRHTDLRDAIRAALLGDPVDPPRTQAIGCDLPDPTVR